MSKGRFLVLEGIDGAGTTTQAALLQQWLEKKGVKTITTREPSDGPIGGTIRNALRGRICLPEAAGLKPLRKETIALLFAADRVDHVYAEIQPALEAGVWVISDRYVHSSIAYQGTLIDVDWVVEINRYAVAPDLNLFLRIEPDVALGRISKTRVQKDLFETRDLLTRIADGYDKFYQKNPEQTVVLDSTLPVDQVHGNIISALTVAFPELA